MMMLSLIRNEVFKIFSYYRTYLSYLFIVLLVPLIFWGFSIGGSTVERQLTHAMGDQFLMVGKLVNAYTVSYFVMNFLWVHIPFLIALVGGDVLAGEEAAGTYRVYLTRPVSRLKIFNAKAIATLIYTLTVILCLAFMSLGVGAVWMGLGDLIVFQDGILVLPASTAFVRFSLAYGLSFLNMAVVASLAIFFSSMVKNAIGPVIGTMAIIIVFLAVSTLPLDFFVSIRPYFFTTYFDSWAKAFFDPIPWDILWQATWVALLHIGLLLGGSYFIFRRKDILS
ncbi:MAG: hypothetical protein COY19_12385 [Candidatus Marinimicrobia bacterium CG_4_10_14_0_2_um_filter_48_9]|nr:MAG: hypothetical protein COY19_12385 [Candidatus Marinimicrobia bacterium CG_4_10_14_0_2_um_filter_48_9]